MTALACPRCAAPTLAVVTVTARPHGRHQGEPCTLYVHESTTRITGAGIAQTHAGHWHPFEPQREHVSTSGGASAGMRDA